MLAIAICQVGQLYCIVFFLILYAGYLASIEEPELTELALNEYRTATNMTDQFSALAAIAQNPGKARDDVLANFYSKWQDDFLVTVFLIKICLNEIFMGVLL